jgi:hypothetical protein
MVSVDHCRVCSLSRFALWLLLRFRWLLLLRLEPLATLGDQIDEGASAICRGASASRRFKSSSSSSPCCLRGVAPSMINMHCAASSTCLHVDAVEPEVTCSVSPKIALPPARMLLRPCLLEPSDGQVREPVNVFALPEVAVGDALRGRGSGPLRPSSVSLSACRLSKTATWPRPHGSRQHNSATGQRRVHQRSARDFGSSQSLLATA